ncbi:DUF3261 domain-containing protein [Simiduia curdlanivorans]|uniref:DUF3261 domain-containing protein n=1 Tax=Simiduia curdlanivorans TaxID=1492769 RepID=A0ABV8V502_9GAMM|nr:DUF3261 domain-containing protein [Simiduia curdlanivorans]MDN3640795.1 DUF3261 domain-containing protein [Simiduia curdlanivorans]
MAAIDLAEPSALGQQVQVTQQVDIAWQGKTHQLMVVWSQQDGLFQVLGMTATGQLLFRAQLDHDEFSQQTFVAELESLDLKQLLQHIQMAYWPEAEVTALLTKNKLQLDVVASAIGADKGAARQRLVRRANRLLARYEFDTDDAFASVRIVADKQPSLTVTTLNVQALNTAQVLGQPRPHVDGAELPSEEIAQ